MYVHIYIYSSSPFYMFQRDNEIVYYNNHNLVSSIPQSEIPPYTHAEVMYVHTYVNSPLALYSPTPQGCLDHASVHCSPQYPSQRTGS